MSEKFSLDSSVIKGIKAGRMRCAKEKRRKSLEDIRKSCIFAGRI